MEDKLVKVLFRFYSDILDEVTVETMWATTIDPDKGLYRIDNIPFYVQALATNDIIFAEYDETEQMLTHRQIIEYSDSSTVQIILMDKSKKINEIRDLFKKIGCPSESLNSNYFAMEIPANVNYKNVKDVLIDFEQKEIIGYNESCLSDKHRNEI